MLSSTEILRTIDRFKVFQKMLEDKGDIALAHAFYAKAIPSLEAELIAVLEEELARD